LRGGEGEWSSWGRQCSVGPISARCVGPAAFCQDQGHEGLLFYGPHGVIADETLNSSHDSIKSVCEEPSATCHVSQDAGHVPPLPLGAPSGLGLNDPECDEIFRVDGGVG